MNDLRNMTMLVLATTVLMVVSATPGFGQDSKQNVLDAAKAIESNTKSREANAAQSNALKWLIETEEVHLIVCNTFSLFSDKKNKNASDMTAAYMIGMGAFKLSNPDKADDENAAQLAGLLLALKAYEWDVKDKPKTKFEKIEDLLKKRDAGELEAIINGFDCGKK